MWDHGRKKRLFGHLLWSGSRGVLKGLMHWRQEFWAGKTQEGLLCWSDTVNQILFSAVAVPNWETGALRTATSAKTFSLATCCFNHCSVRCNQRRNLFPTFYSAKWVKRQHLQVEGWWVSTCSSIKKHIPKKGCLAVGMKTQQGYSWKKRLFCLFSLFSDSVLRPGSLVNGVETKKLYR